MHLPSLVLLMFFSLTDPAVFLSDHAIYFIITHNEKMPNHFRIFFQKRSIFPGCFSISETYSFPSFLLFQTPQLFFLPVLQFFHQFPYFQAAQSHSFLLPVLSFQAIREGNTLRGNLLFKNDNWCRDLPADTSVQYHVLLQDRAHLHGAGQQAHSPDAAIRSVVFVPRSTSSMTHRSGVFSRLASQNPF